MLPLPRAKSDWLETACRLAKIWCERHPVTCHNVSHLQSVDKQAYYMFTSQNESLLMLGCKYIN